MSLKIYNSLTRKQEDFDPLDPEKKIVRMYVCGPTVYDEPHIGHLRSAYIFDMMRRYLESKFCGYNVKLVRNVTDVDDKIIDKARSENPSDLQQAVKEVCDKYYKMYESDLSEMNIARPWDEPRATEFIDQIKRFIQHLIDNGSAYPVGGDVYFDVTKFADYGLLSGQKKDQMMEGVKSESNDRKRNSLDFALWKEAKPNEPSWEGPIPNSFGRPGWHIECSVMSYETLGETFDIHGGGRDLIFPHHENEIAQSRSFSKKSFMARYWIHHGLVTVNGQKMSKSLKNYITLTQLREKLHPFAEDILKFVFLSTHYSQPLDVSVDKIQSSRAYYFRFRNLFDAAWQFGSDMSSPDKENFKLLRDQFKDAMNSDFNSPLALKILYDLSESAWKARDEAMLVAIAKEVLQIFQNVFGLYVNFEIHKEIEANLRLQDLEFQADLQARIIARETKNFTLADKIRNKWESKGIEFLDFPTKTIWRRKI